MIKRTDGGKLCTERFYEPGTGRIDRQTVKGGGTACSGSAIATFDLSYDASSNVATRVQTVGTGTGANPKTAPTPTPTTRRVGSPA